MIGAMAPPLRAALFLMGLLLLARSGARAHRVLVIGTGGREHAIAAALSRSPKVEEVLVLPGNAAMPLTDPKIRCTLESASEGGDVVELAKSYLPSLVVIGPEKPLAEGLADRLREEGLPVCAPSQRATRIESDKAWARRFMSGHGVRSPRFKAATSLEEALAAASDIGKRAPPVLKRIGLHAGKGVRLPTSDAECDEMLRYHFASFPGETLLLEERLFGPEVSLFAFSDGEHAVFSPPSTDHKRLLEGDEGVNTGGMGAVCPVTFVSSDELEEMQRLMRRTLDGLREEGTPFQGVLYGGFILDEDRTLCRTQQVFVLEFNARLGDPEAQAMLPLLETDAFALFAGAARPPVPHETTSIARPRFARSMHAASVVLASDGYPSSSPREVPLYVGASPLPVPRVHDGGAGFSAFFAGVRGAVGGEGRELVTSGGRVLCGTGVGRSPRAALCNAYAGLQSLRFEGQQLRGDIGRKATLLGSAEPLRIAVLASGRGSSVRALVEALAGGQLDRCTLATIVSNHASAPVLAFARERGLPHVCVERRGGQSREQHDGAVEGALLAAQADLVLLVGYDRLLSKGFCDRWLGAMLNVHPALLPEALRIPGAAGKGAFDLKVHDAVLRAGAAESGCTVHLVTAEADRGPAFLRKVCRVAEQDTAETLRARVQSLEGAALHDAVVAYRDMAFGGLVLNP